jgi:hypothetical protein
MAVHHPISKATDSPRPLGEGLGVRSGQFLKAVAVSTEKAVETKKLTRRQIEVTMFVVAVGTLEGLQARKFMEEN